MELPKIIQNYLVNRRDISLRPEMSFDPPLAGIQQNHILTLLRDYTGVEPLEDVDRQFETWMIQKPHLVMLVNDLVRKISEPSSNKPRRLSSKEFFDVLRTLSDSKKSEFVSYLQGLLEKNIAKSVPDDFGLPETFRAELNSMIESWGKKSRAPKQHEETPLPPKSGHFTRPQRHADSNRFLAEYFVRESTLPQTPKAIFVGGSVGFTASDFYREMCQAGLEGWEVINLDLALPEEIISSLFQKNGSDFIRPDFITYVQQDMRKYDFGRDRFDFVDFCNSSGYIADLNERLETARRTWHALKVGGVFRIAPPVADQKLFEQFLCVKTGLGYWDFDPLFLSNSGKTPYLSDSVEEACREARLITDQYLSIRQNLLKGKDLKDYPLMPDNKMDAFVQDLAFINPIGYLGGLLDTSTFFQKKSEEEDSFHLKASIRAQLASLT